MVRAKGFLIQMSPGKLWRTDQKEHRFSQGSQGSSEKCQTEALPDPPFLKMTILGDYIWLQHYQPAWMFKGRLSTYLSTTQPREPLLSFYQYFLEGGTT